MASIGFGARSRFASATRMFKLGRSMTAHRACVKRMVRLAGPNQRTVTVDVSPRVSVSRANSRATPLCRVTGSTGNPKSWKDFEKAVGVRWAATMATPVTADRKNANRNEPRTNQNGANWIAHTPSSSSSCCAHPGSNDRRGEANSVALRNTSRGAARPPVANEPSSRSPFSVKVTASPLISSGIGIGIGGAVVTASVMSAPEIGNRYRYSAVRSAATVPSAFTVPPSTISVNGLSPRLDKSTSPSG